MKVGIIVPTRGDRPEFLENCKRLIEKQTLRPDKVFIVNFVPVTEDCDITKRYRYGYDKLRGLGLDVIAFMEDDDWYSEDYLAVMVENWLLHGRPDLFGTNYTIYYNLRALGYFPMNHHQRSSAMSTLIKPDLNFKWCADTEPYTDVHLYSTLKYKLFHPKKYICLGMKHGIGKTGGKQHVDRLFRYTTLTGTPDPDLEFLQRNVDIDSFNFYCEIARQFK